MLRKPPMWTCTTWMDERSLETLEKSKERMKQDAKRTTIAALRRTPKPEMLEYFMVLNGTRARVPSESQHPFLTDGNGICTVSHALVVKSVSERPS